VYAQLVRMGVMSLPTTVIIGADGDVAAINVGFALPEKLAAQLSAVGVFTPV
jgi:hypothetical protein